MPLDEAEDTIAAAEGDPAQLTVSADETRILLDALNALPADLSEVVRLALVYELPYAEIAALINIPQGTVKSRVSRARRLLREELGKSHE